MLTRDDQLRKFFKEHSDARTVVSDGTGIGKSRAIENQIESMEKEYVRIILSGDMTVQKFIDLHEEKESFGDPGYHYDIYPCS